MTDADGKRATSEVREVARALLEAEQQRDLATTMAFMTEDTIMQAPGAPQIQGVEAMRSFLEELFKTAMGDFDAAPIRIVVAASGDLACDIGWFRMPAEGPNGPVMELGKYTIVWQKVDGEWKYVVGCFNHNAKGEPPMSAKNNTEVAQLYHEFNPDDLDDILSPDFVGHSNNPGSGFNWDAEAHRQFWSRGEDQETGMWRETVHELIAEREFVAARVTRAGTYQGREVQAEMMRLIRFENGKIAEIWEYADPIQWDQ